jgi:hypothetical protein
MKRLSDFELWSLSDWWMNMLATAILFSPPGVIFGYAFLGDVLRGDLVAPGMTSRGYFGVVLPGVTSAACLGTVVLRLAGKPNVWLICASVLLVFMTSGFWVTLLMLGMLGMLVPMSVAIPALIALVAGMASAGAWLWSDHVKARDNQ